ncbi:MAG: hypothetical protein K1W22_09910 [Lachnospiraceae bacterium]
MKDNIKILQEDNRELKNDVQVLKDDVQGLKSDVLVLKDDVQGLKGDVLVLKDDVVELKSDVHVLKDDVLELKDDSQELKNRAVRMELTLENETNPGIKIVAEGHLDLNRKLNDALRVESEKEMLLLRVNHLENEVRKVKEKLNQTA